MGELGNGNAGHVSCEPCRIERMLLKRFPRARRSAAFCAQGVLREEIGCDLVFASAMFWSMILKALAAREFFFSFSSDVRMA